MSQYIDGFVIPIATKNITAYRRIASKAGKIWIEHGALDYRECVGDDLNIKGFAAFPAMVKTKRGETVVFSWAAFKSRKHRDQVNKRIMKDPRIAAMADECGKIFDCKRMIYGGFKTIVGT